MIRPESRSMTASPVLTGAERLVRCLEQHGVEYIFGLSGGAAMPIFDALVDSKIKLILTRHEQGASHMADGYARATGRPGVVLVTSGPGATNTVTGLLTALMDSVPMIVLTGQTPTFNLGKDAFQEADVTGITYPVVKHSYLVTDVNDIPRVVNEAFYLATSGRPGPVLIDLPKDVTSGPCTAPEPRPACRTFPATSCPSTPSAARCERAAAAARQVQAPGAVRRPRRGDLGRGRSDRRAREKLQAPVVNTLLGKGAVDETTPLHLGMLGMHGTAYANKAVIDCDLIMAIGARWDDRITGKVSEFCTDATRIHVDIDPAEFDKTVHAHVQLLGDARLVIEDLLPLVERSTPTRGSRSATRGASSSRSTTRKTIALRAQHVLDRLNAVTEGRALLTTDVGQHQMWAAQFCLTRANRMWLSSGGAGTMGFGFPAAIGAQFARPDIEVWAIVGDGGFQMTMSELATAAVHKLPVKVLIINNHYLGMVRQWQELFFDNRLSRRRPRGQPGLRQARGRVRHQGLLHPQAGRGRRGAEAKRRRTRRAVRGRSRGRKGRQRVPDDPGRRRAARHDHRAAQAQAREADG